MLLSIIIPAHNHAKVISRAVESASERGDRVEVIVVDDGSTDHTAIVIERIIHSRSDVRYVYQQEQGLAAAQSLGAQVARGQYLLFLNAKDELTDASVAVVLAAIDSYPDGNFFVAPYLLMDQAIVQERRLVGFSESPEVRFERFLFGRLSVVHGACVFRRTLFTRIQSTDAQLCLDDRSVFALSLLDPVCIKLAVPLVCINESEGDSQIVQILDKGLLMVDALFDHEMLPNMYRHLRERYRVRKALELYEQALLQGDDDNAAALYQQAVRLSPSIVFRANHTARYLWLLCKRH